MTVSGGRGPRVALQGREDHLLSRRARLWMGKLPQPTWPARGAPTRGFQGLDLNVPSLRLLVNSTMGSAPESPCRASCRTEKEKSGALIAIR